MIYPQFQPAPPAVAESVGSLPFHGVRLRLPTARDVIDAIPQGQPRSVAEPLSICARISNQRGHQRG